ncbi:DUF4982 domain-containing protein [Sphingobium sp. CAP-1]|uniref:DUF4982 domain-containing protein n=1 Tax=Sphingobium sp. CAP-1 TaxID=2676077 RepID=UPI001E46B5BB|nr:DUF4982 domain-containing protein [Sphingobium sp. CAP-1]
MLATNLERVELWCNGRRMGEGAPDPYDMISFDVPFEAGTLEARGWRGGRMVQRHRVETTGAPVRLRLSADRMDLAGDGIDAQPVRIEALDARGRRVPTADLDLTLSITNGRIIGVGNGDPTSLAPSKGGRVKLFNGLAQAIIQTDRESSGKLSFSAAASGVRPAGIVIAIRAAAVRQSLPPSLQQSVSMWRQSPVQAERPKVIPDLADNDMNSWDPVIAGEQPAAASGNGYVILAAKVTLSDQMSASGAVLRFAEIKGAGEVLLNGVPTGHKATVSPGPLDIAIPVGLRDMAVALVLSATGGQPVGLSGPVFLRAAQ